MFTWIFQDFNLCPLPLMWTQGTTQKCVAQSSLLPPLRYLYTLVSFSLSFLFPRLSSPSPQLLPFVRWSSPSVTLWPFTGLISMMSKSLWYWGAWSGHSTPALVPPMSKAQDHPLSLLNMPCLAWSRRLVASLLHCYTVAHGQLDVHQDPQVILCKAAFQPVSPQNVLLHGIALAQLVVIKTCDFNYFHKI